MKNLHSTMHFLLLLPKYYAIHIMKTLQEEGIMENESVNDFPRGQLNPTILSTLAECDKYGYEIIDEIKTKTGIEIKQPSLYSSLKRMEVQKLISSYWKDSEIGGRRHYYCLTNDGKNFLQKNPVDFSQFSSHLQTAPLKQEVPSELEIPVRKETTGQTGKETIAQQENLFAMAISKANEEPKVESIEEPAPEKEDNQCDLFTEINLAEDDGVFLTETLDDYTFPKFEKFEPATLNIETSGNANYLNTKIKERELLHEDNKAKQEYQEKISSMFAKKPVKEKVEPYDHEKSMATIENKINRFEAQKTEKAYYEKQSMHDTQQTRNGQIAAENEIKQAQANIKGTEFNRVENTYERIKQTTPIFNSYKSLETYYNSKGIGFVPYVKKEKTAADFVHPSLIRLIRCSLFFLLSLMLSLAFYFGVTAEGIGKEIYIVIPCLTLALTALYGYYFYKSRRRSIIQNNKSSMSPVILPVISICMILIIVAINLIIGFRADTTLYYFPLLIYPIILSIHLAIIAPLNIAINWCVLKFRQLVKR